MLSRLDVREGAHVEAEAPSRQGDRGHVVVPGKLQHPDFEFRGGMTAERDTAVVVV